MEHQIYTFHLRLDWKLIAGLSRIDRFDASWMAIEKLEGQALMQLKEIATVRSVGASTRIEGSKMSDEQVESLLDHLDISKLSNRDEQEVAGYFTTMDLISESFEDIEIRESDIKSLHNTLLKHSVKDAWHRGNYKQHSNVVEAISLSGERQVIFQTTEPGFATDDAMRRLISWYHSDDETHPLVKCALFAYEFLSIHPFQDGNGRLSRLLTNLLLLKNGYRWIQYVSFEHEIEHQKAAYYKTLMQCQKQRPGEDVYPWLMFFFDALNNMHSQLWDKLSAEGDVAQLSPKEKSIYVFIGEYPGCQSGDISGRLNIPLPTVKRLLKEMSESGLIRKHGIGAGTNYSH